VAQITRVGLTLKGIHMIRGGWTGE